MPVAIGGMEGEDGGEQGMMVQPASTWFWGIPYSLPFVYRVTHTCAPCVWSADGVNGEGPRAPGSAAGLGHGVGRRGLLRGSPLVNSISLLMDEKAGPWDFCSLVGSQTSSQGRWSSYSETQPPNKVK
jgi:hypothetical protein